MSCQGHSTFYNHTAEGATGGVAAPETTWSGRGTWQDLDIYIYYIYIYHGVPKGGAMMPKSKFSKGMSPRHPLTQSKQNTTL